MSIAETRFSRKHGAGGPGTAGFSPEAGGVGIRQQCPSRAAGLPLLGVEKVSIQRTFELASAATLGAFSAPRRGSGGESLAPVELHNVSSGTVAQSSENCREGFAEDVLGSPGWGMLRARGLISLTAPPAPASGISKRGQRCERCKEDGETPEEGRKSPIQEAS